MGEQDNELKAVKQRLEQLESQIEQMRANKNTKRSNGLNFLIAFVIVFAALFISIGVIQFISSP